MALHDLPDLSRTLAIVLAGGRATRLHELSLIEAKPALPFAGRRLADFGVAAVAEAGLSRLLALLGTRSATLERHLPELWGDRLALTLDTWSDAGTLAALARVLPSAKADHVLILPADQIHALDLRALLAAHRQAGADATLATRDGLAGLVVLDVSALRAALDGDAAGDLWGDLLPRWSADGRLATWTPPEGTYWRDIDTLDDLREAALDFQRGTPCALPPGEEAAPLNDNRDLAFVSGGIALSVPRFGARQPGRWTVLEDTVVLPGARVASGARLTRAILAPGAIIPAGLIVGEDPAEDARWFRVTPRGTTLVTPPMLAARAAERMRARLSSRPPAGLAHSGPR